MNYLYSLSRSILKFRKVLSLSVVYGGTLIAPNAYAQNCDFWAGECESAKVADPLVGADFWSKPHTEEINRRQRVEEQRVRAEKQARLAENRRRDEIAQLRREREQLQRQREQQYAEDSRRRNSRNNQPNMGGWGNIAKAANIFAGEAYKQIDAINAETARRQAETNRRIVEDNRRRRKEEVDRKNAEIDRRIADLERQSRKAEVEAARKSHERQQSIERQNAAQTDGLRSRLAQNPISQTSPARNTEANSSPTYASDAHSETDKIPGYIFSVCREEFPKLNQSLGVISSIQTIMYRSGDNYTSQKMGTEAARKYEQQVIAWNQVSFERRVCHSPFSYTREKAEETRRTIMRSFSESGQIIEFN